MRTGDMGDDGSGVELAQTVAADVKNIDAVMVSRVISPPEEFYKGVLVNRAAKSTLNPSLPTKKINCCISTT